MKDRDAILGGPGQIYRYALSRVSDERINTGMAQRLLWVMLNPSTADSQYDDATIRKCMSFARHWGFGVMRVVNLYAYRATDPKELRRKIEEYKTHGLVDPIGPSNDNYIKDMGRWSHEVCVAWGANAEWDRAQQVYSILADVTTADRVFMLGKTKGEQPVHPLYQKLVTPRIYINNWD